MHILIIGGTQFFGRKAVELLLEQDHRITLLSRGNAPLPGKEGQIEHLIADRNCPRQMHELLAGRNFDAVFDNIAMNGDHVATVVEAIGQTRQYLLMSSGSVYHHSGHIPAGDFVFCTTRGKSETDSWTDMMKPLSEEAVPPDVQWLKRAVKQAKRPYRKGKLEAERQLVRAAKKQQLHFTIFRPPQVEGPWDPTGRTEFFARRVEDGGGIIIRRSQRGRVFQKVYRDDVAKAVITAVGNRRAYDRVYNLAQPEVLSLERYLYVIAYCLGAKPPQIVDLPDERLNSQLPGYSPPVPSPKTVSTAPAAADLGFCPAPYTSWMNTTLEWIFSRPAGDEYQADRSSELALM